MNLAKLPEILLKLSMAGVEFAVTGNPLPLAAKFVELGSEEITEAAKELLARKEAAERLMVALQQAEQEFNRRWQEDHPGTSSLLVIVPKLDVTKLQKTIAVIPAGFSERDAIIGALALIQEVGFPTKEARQAAGLWVECLERALMPLQEYALPIMFEKLSGIKKDTTETLEIARRLDRKVTGERSSALSSPKPRFLIPFPRNERFVGREDDLAELHKALQGGKAVGVRPAALTGMGGIGKTQLAVEYAYRYKDAYPGGVYWINAAQDWRKEFADRAVEIGLSAGDAPESERLVRLALSFVDFLNDHPDALVIFDNVDQPRQLTFAEAGFIPSQLKCRLLFTTRRREYDLPFRSFEVRVLPEDVALKLLLGSAARKNLLETPGIEQDEAKQICWMFGDLPLALALAAAYLGKYPRVSLAGYRQRLLAEGLEAVDRTGIDPQSLPTRHDHAVAATLEMQYQALESENAKLVLQAAAIQGEAVQVPLARLALMTGLDGQPKPGYPNPMQEALTELQGLFLIEELKEDALRLHPLVAKFVDSLENRAAFAAACTERLADALWDMARFESGGCRRGIDALLADLRVGVALVPPEREDIAAV